MPNWRRSKWKGAQKRKQAGYDNAAGEGVAGPFAFGFRNAEGRAQMQTTQRKQPPGKGGKGGNNGGNGNGKGKLAEDGFGWKPRLAKSRGPGNMSTAKVGYDELDVMFSNGKGVFETEENARTDAHG